MRIIKLALSNFRGLKDFVLIADGRDVTIKGDNGTGKTTIADAVHWLLWGKDSAGRGQFEIKTIDPATGEPVHNVNHTATMVVEHDGLSYEFSKTYKEVWTRENGSSKDTFSGNTTIHRLNGIEQSKTQYDKAIAGICDAQAFRLLCDPQFFCGVMEWKKRREFLLEMCGDVTDDDVIATHPEFADLPAMVGKRTRDEYAAILRQNRKEWNKRLSALPDVINEAKRATDAPSGDTEDTAALRQVIDELRTKRAGIVNGTATVQLDAQLRTIDADMSRIKTELTANANRPYLAAKARLAELVQDSNDAATAAARALNRKQEAERDLEAARGRLATLRDRNVEIKSRTFQHDGESTCPTCGQDLPASAVAEARRDAEARFNQQRASDLERCIEDGNAAKERVAALEADVAKFAEEHTEAEAELTRVLEAVADARAKEQEAKSTELDPMDDEAYAALSVQRKNVQDQLDTLRRDAQAEAESVTEEIAAKESEMQAINERNAARVAAAKQAARVEELTAEQKRLAAEYERADNELRMLEEFTMAKARMLTQRINAKFTMVRWRLFEVQVNGGVNEVCDAVYNGVGWSDMSNAERINAGLDVINAIADHMNFAPPVIIDNAEGVTRLTPTRGQQIRLVVSPDHMTPTVIQ